MQNYRVTKRKLGEGHFGSVDLVARLVDGETFVLKKVSLDDLTPAQRENAKREVDFLKGLCHPCIVEYIESFIENNVLHIVMEYCEQGDMASRIAQAKASAEGKLDESLVLDWFAQISLGLQKCHEAKVMHRDLKPQNVFITKDDLVKLGDFGIARVVNENEMAQTTIGTPYSMSPEILKNEPYSYKADIWSLGCVLYEMATSERPFGGGNFMALVLRVVQHEFNSMPLESCGETVKSLVGLMLQKDAKDRPTIDEIVARPDLTQLVDNVYRRHSELLKRKHRTASLKRSNNRRRGGQGAGGGGGNQHQQQHQHHNQNLARADVHGRSSSSSNGGSISPMARHNSSSFNSGTATQKSSRHRDRDRDRDDRERDRDRDRDRHRDRDRERDERGDGRHHRDLESTDTPPSGSHSRHHSIDRHLYERERERELSHSHRDRDRDRDRERERSNVQGRRSLSSSLSSSSYTQVEAPPSPPPKPKSIRKRRSYSSSGPPPLNLEHTQGPPPGSSDHRMHPSPYGHPHSTRYPPTSSASPSAAYGGRYPREREREAEPYPFDDDLALPSFTPPSAGHSHLSHSTRSHTTNSSRRTYNHNARIEARNSRPNSARNSISNSSTSGGGGLLRSPPTSPSGLPHHLQQTSTPSSRSPTVMSPSASSSSLVSAVTSVPSQPSEVASSTPSKKKSRLKRFFGKRPRLSSADRTETIPRSRSDPPLQTQQVYSQSQYPHPATRSSHSLSKSKSKSRGSAPPNGGGGGGAPLHDFNISTSHPRHQSTQPSSLSRRSDSRESDSNSRSSTSRSVRYIDPYHPESISEEPYEDFDDTLIEPIGIGHAAAGQPPLPTAVSTLAMRQQNSLSFPRRVRHPRSSVNRASVTSAPSGSPLSSPRGSFGVADFDDDQAAAVAAAAVAANPPGRRIVRMVSPRLEERSSRDRSSKQRDTPTYRSSVASPTNSDSYVASNLSSPRTSDGSYSMQEEAIRRREYEEQYRQKFEQNSHYISKVSARSPADSSQTPVGSASAASARKPKLSPSHAGNGGTGTPRQRHSGGKSNTPFAALDRPPSRTRSHSRRNSVQHISAGYPPERSMSLNRSHSRRSSAHYTSSTLKVGRPASARTSRDHSRRSSMHHVSPSFSTGDTLSRSKPSSRRNSLHHIAALAPDRLLSRSSSDSRSDMHQISELGPDSRPLSRSRSDSRRNSVMNISALEHNRPLSRNSGGRHSRRSSVPQLSSADLSRFASRDKAAQNSSSTPSHAQRKMSPQSVPANQRRKLTRFAERDDIIGHARAPANLPPLELDNDDNRLPSASDGTRLQHSQSARYPRPSSRNRDRGGVVAAHHGISRGDSGRSSGPRSPKVDPDGPHFRHKRVPSREEHIAAMVAKSVSPPHGKERSTPTATLMTPTASSSGKMTPSPHHSPKPSRATRPTPVLRGESELYDDIVDMDNRGFHHPHHRLEREVYIMDNTRGPSPPRRSQTSMGFRTSGDRRPSALDTSGSRSQSPSFTYMTRAESVPPTFSESPRKNNSPRKRKARSAQGRVPTAMRSPRGPGAISLGRLSSGGSSGNSSNAVSPRATRASSTGRMMYHASASAASAAGVPHSPRTHGGAQFSPHSPRSPRLRSSSGSRSRRDRDEFSIQIDDAGAAGDEDASAARMSEPVRSPRQQQHVDNRGGSPHPPPVSAAAASTSASSSIMSPRSPKTQIVRSPRSKRPSSHSASAAPTPSNKRSGSGGGSQQQEVPRRAETARPSGRTRRVSTSAKRPPIGDLPPSTNLSRSADRDSFTSNDRRLPQQSAPPSFHGGSGTQSQQPTPHRSPSARSSKNFGSSKPLAILTSAARSPRTGSSSSRKSARSGGGSRRSSPVVTPRTDAGGRSPPRATRSARSSFSGVRGVGGIAPLDLDYHPSSSKPRSSVPGLDQYHSRSPSGHEFRGDAFQYGEAPSSDRTTYRRKMASLPRDKQAYHSDQHHEFHSENFDAPVPSQKPQVSPSASSMITSPRMRSRKQQRGAPISQYSPSGSSGSLASDGLSLRDRRAVSVPDDTIRSSSGHLPRTHSAEGHESTQERHRRVRSAGRVVDKRGRVNVSATSAKATSSPPKSSSPISFSTPSSPLMGPLPSSVPTRPRRAATHSALSSPSFSYTPHRSDNFASMKRSFRTNAKQEAEFRAQFQRNVFSGRGRAQSLSGEELQRSKSFDVIRTSPSSNRSQKSPDNKSSTQQQQGNNKRPPLPSPRRASDTAALSRRGASAGTSKTTSSHANGDTNAKKSKPKKKEEPGKSTGPKEKDNSKAADVKSADTKEKDNSKASDVKRTDTESETEEKSSVEKALPNHKSPKGIAALSMILGGSPVISPVVTGLKGPVQTTDTDTDYELDSFEDYNSGSSDEDNPRARTDSGDRGRNARPARDRARAKRDQRRRAESSGSGSGSNRSSLEAPLRAESNLHRQRRAQMSQSQATSPRMPSRGSREREHRRERVETYAHGARHAYVDRDRDDPYERASLATVRSPRGSPRNSYAGISHGDSYAQRSPSRMSSGMSRSNHSPQSSLERRRARGTVGSSSRTALAGSPPRGANYYPLPLTLRDRSSSAGSMSSAGYEPIDPHEEPLSPSHSAAPRRAVSPDIGGSGHRSPPLKPRSRPATLRRKASSLRRSSARYSNATVAPARDASHAHLPPAEFYDPPSGDSPSHRPIERMASAEKLHSLQRSHTDQAPGIPSPKLRSRKLKDRKYHTYGHKQARRNPAQRVYPHVVQQQKAIKQRDRSSGGSGGRARASSSTSPPPPRRVSGSPQNTASRRYPAATAYRDRVDPTDPNAPPLSPLSPMGGPHGVHSLPHTPLSSSRTSNPLIHGGPPPPLQLSRSHLSRAASRSQYYRGSPHSNSSTASSHGGNLSPSSQPHTRSSGASSSRRNAPSSRSAAAYHGGASMQTRSVPPPADHDFIEDDRHDEY